ncbi:hypothetical protein MASR2M79_17580 [Aminivibrio sp.]
MIKMSAMQVGVKAESNNQLSASDLEGTDAKTLIVTSGTSMKGMGAAGTNVDKEIERCTELIAAAKEAGIQVVGVTSRDGPAHGLLRPGIHRGGHEGRRYHSCH